jgi:hypothetical protein
LGAFFVADFFAAFFGVGAAATAAFSAGGFDAAGEGLSPATRFAVDLYVS